MLDIPMPADIKIEEHIRFEVRIRTEGLVREQARYIADEHLAEKHEGEAWEYQAEYSAAPPFVGWVVVYCQT